MHRYKIINTSNVFDLTSNKNVYEVLWCLVELLLYFYPPSYPNIIQSLHHHSKDLRKEQKKMEA